MKTKAAAKSQPGQSSQLAAHFGAERWERLQRQALNSCGLDAEELQALCVETLATSAEWHPDNAAAALCSAGDRLLIHLGSSLTPEDVSRFEAALQGGSRTSDEASEGGVKSET